MLYYDWKMRKTEEIIFNCNSGGIPHQHCMDILIAERMNCYFGPNEVRLCLAGRTNEGFQAYLQNHSADRRIHMVDTEDKLYEGETCYFTFIAPKNELHPLYERVKNIEGINCIFQQDKYRPEYWLELCPGNATKASAIQRVKQLCGCQRISKIMSVGKSNLRFLYLYFHAVHPGQDFFFKSLIQRQRFRLPVKKI